jgi:hypothetical protein
VHAENPVLACDRASRRNGRAHFFASIGDQRWKTGRRAIATVSPSDCPHAVHRGLIVEQDAAAAIDLQIYEPGCQKYTGRQTGLRAVRANLGRCADSNNEPVPDKHRGPVMPAVAVKNAVCQHRMCAGRCGIISTLFHLP